MCVFRVKAGRTSGEPHNPIMTSSSTILVAAFTEPSSSREGDGGRVHRGEPPPPSQRFRCLRLQRELELSLPWRKSVQPVTELGLGLCHLPHTPAFVWEDTRAIPSGGLAWKQPTPLIPHPHPVEAQALKQFLNFSLGFMCLCYNQGLTVPQVFLRLSETTAAPLPRYCQPPCGL